MAVPLLASYGGVIELSVFCVLVASNCYAAARSEDYSKALRVWAGVGAAIWLAYAALIVATVRCAIQSFVPTPDWVRPILIHIGTRPYFTLWPVVLLVWTAGVVPFLIGYAPCLRQSVDEGELH